MTKRTIKLDYFIYQNNNYINNLEVNSINFRKEKVNSKNDNIIIKFLQENSDFYHYKLDKDFLSRFLRELYKIEINIPPENIRKLSELISDKNTQPRIIIEKVFQTKFNDDITKILVSSFEKELLGQSKKINRLILFYKLDENKFTIIHTTKKKHLCAESQDLLRTLIIKESFWDFKDYLRIIIFQLKNSEIIIKAKEYSESSFFDRWLNFKKIRKSYNTDLAIEFEFSKSRYGNYTPDFSELYDGLINGDIKVSGNKLILGDRFKDSKESFNIKSIEYNDRIYQSKQEYKVFINEFKTNQKYPTLVILNNKFIEFIKRQNYELISWNQENPCKQLNLLENKNEIYHPSIENVNFNKKEIEDFDFILCSGRYKNYLIYPDDMLIKQIRNAILDFNNTFKIIKLGKQFNIQKPFKINNLIIFNEVKINRVYYRIEKKITDLAKKRDNDIKNIIYFLKFFLFQKLLIDNDFKSLFKTILKDITVSIDLDEFYDKENEILEFKDKRFYENKGRDEITKNFLDITQKYFHYEFKFIIIGFNEKNEIDGINEKFIHLDWIGHFEDQLNIFLKSYNKKAFIQQIPINNKSKKSYIIIFIIY